MEPELRPSALYMVAGAAAVVAAYLVVTKGTKVIGEAAQAVNPFNPENVINQGFHSVYSAVTDGQGTLGTDLYDITHDGTFNPVSDNNLAYRSANAWVEKLTGQKGQTLGGWFYDITH